MGVGGGSGDLPQAKDIVNWLSPHLKTVKLGKMIYALFGHFLGHFHGKYV